MKLQPAFTGILVAKGLDKNDFSDMIPEGMIPVDHLHVTLLSSELPKELRAKIKKDFSILDKLEFPDVTFGNPYIVDNGTKRSAVVDLNEQEPVRLWVKLALALFEIDTSIINPARVYHVSIANKTGSQFDSVPDPWNHKV
jgi:hypothetical protein